MSAVDQGRVGELLGSDGAIQPLRLTRKGGLAAADVQARYQESVLRGNVYFLSLSAGAPTAFIGAAGGTPLLGIYNPAGSGKALVLLVCSGAETTVPSAAGVIDYEMWAGVSVLPTGTVTTPTNMASQQATGSAAKGFVNTAMTGSTAINLVTPVNGVYWATAAGSNLVGTGLVDLAGMIVATPGVLVAFGSRTALTSTVTDAFLMWEEVPYP